MRRRAPQVRSGFSLIELLIVVVIVGLLASIAVPAYSDIQQTALDNVVLSDIQSAQYAIEEFVTENMALPGDEDQLMDAGFALSPGVYFDKFDVKDADDPELARVHMHVAHQASPYYYHVEYPSTEGAEHRWKK